MDGGELGVWCQLDRLGLIDSGIMPFASQAGVGVKAWFKIAAFTG